MEKCLMDVVPPLIADGEPAVLRKPSQCALHHPPVPPQLLAALHSLSRYPAPDGTLPEGFFALFVIVSFVGVKLVGTLSRSATGTLDGLYSVDELFENHRVVDVCCAEHHTERDASSVRNKVALGAGFLLSVGFAPVFGPPFWPGCSPSPNKSTPTLSGRLRQDDPRAPGAAASRPLPPATHARVASTYLQSHSPSLGATSPRECRSLGRR